jgi:tRNA G18 (ribose-2'-O)-methylase SpoU
VKSQRPLRPAQGAGKPSFSKTKKHHPSPRREPGKPGDRPKSRDRGALPDGVFMVEGVAAIREYLRHKPASILKLYAKERTIAKAREELSPFKIDLICVPDSDDESLPRTIAWAQVRHETTPWETFMARLEKQKETAAGTDRLILVIDHISDPRNLGAIIRSAAFFGIRHVIVPEKRQVLLTQAGVNTAQGGFALTDLVVAVNVSRVLEELKQHDYWILGAAMGGEAVSAVRGRYDRQVLVLGSEDKGISPTVLGRCDVVVAIPGALKSLESLNVSVAAGILIHELAGPR